MFFMTSANFSLFLEHFSYCCSKILILYLNKISFEVQLNFQVPSTQRKRVRVILHDHMTNNMRQRGIPRIPHNLYPINHHTATSLRSQIILQLISFPSQAPSNFTMTASSSTSITVSWQLPPADYRHGIISD